MLKAWTGAGEATPRGRRPAAALGLLAAIALVIAGCGGGDAGGESESAARKKLEAGAQMTSEAESLRLSLLLETEEEGESETVGCLKLDADTAKPESFDLLLFNFSCEGGTEAHELIAIGRRAWASTGPESWREAKITPALLREISDEQTDFGELMAAAEDVKVVPDGQADERYSFKAPASAFPGSTDLGDLEVEFEATLDPRGYLRELVVHGDEDGAGATVTANYKNIDEPLEIQPPHPDE
jgi:hypothetical protein